MSVEDYEDSNNYKIETSCMLMSQGKLLEVVMGKTRRMDVEACRALSGSPPLS
jgi:hypothetical protein